MPDNPRLKTKPARSSVFCEPQHLWRSRGLLSLAVGYCLFLPAVKGYSALYLESSSIAPVQFTQHNQVCVHSMHALVLSFGYVGASVNMLGCL